MDVRVQGGEAQITLDLRDLEDIVEDLNSVEHGLSPRSQDFLDALYEKGVK